MSKEESESDLIASAVAGDDAAIQRLLFRHYDRLHRRISRKLPSDLRAKVGEEDILQQAFVEAFRDVRGFEPQGKWGFYRWLATIADHRLQDAIKAERAEKRGGGRTALNDAPHKDWSSSVAELLDLLAASRHTPSQSAARHEAISALHVGLASLKEEYRVAIQLRYFEGMSVADAARVMNKSPRAVHNLCYRGLRELHAVLGRSSQFLTRK